MSKRFADPQLPSTSSICNLSTSKTATSMDVDEGTVDTTTKDENNVIENKYNEIYNSLESISKIIIEHDNGKLEKKLKYLYTQCNQLISNLSLKETFPSLIDSLQQLQYALDDQIYLIKKIDGPITYPTTKSQLPIKLPPVKAASFTQRLNKPATVTSVDPKAKARNTAILQMKKVPSCEGFHQVAGLEEAKQILNEALILPSKFPQLFQGPRKPWTSILLYGPPGTGKTRLAHAVAAEINADFYSISASDLLSSFVGESEKLVRELFTYDNKDSSKKCIIFIDEIDSICRKRNSNEAEHARSLKTELLIQMEESSNKRDKFILCATNCPWDIDAAFIRRFQRRIYIPTPNKDARLSLLKIHSGINDPIFNWNPIVDNTEGYSGSDLANLTQSALLMPVKELEYCCYWNYRNDGMLVPCHANQTGSIFSTLSNLPSHLIGVRDVELNDFLTALTNTSSTISPEDLVNYENFTMLYGQYV